jgi:hypothetical protein
MRGFTSATSVDLLACGHAFIQNLRNGFSTLTAVVPREVRVMTTWLQLVQSV